MLTESNKILLIDDNQDDLIRLSQVFYDKGIGCRKLIYDAFYDRPLSDVRVLFMDINLNYANETDEKKRNATLKDALNLYIAENNGPYVLVFWTSNVEWKDSFLEFMKRDAIDLPVSPLYVTTMAKDDFSVDKVDAIFGESPVRILFEYEEEMSNSISAATTQILNTIPKDANWGETNVFDSNFKDVFSSIAMQNAGYEFAKQDPDRAIKEALIPIYAHDFLNRKSELWEGCLRNLFQTKEEKEFSFPNDYNLAKLNTIFHIDTNTDNLSKKCRGVVCSINIEQKDLLSLFSGVFDNEKDKWQSFFPPLKNAKDYENAQFICVELSASCDYAQNRERTNKYLLGMMIPLDPSEKLKFKDTTPNSILIVEFPFVIGERSFKACFNLNFTFTINSGNEALIGEPICQFKKELMDMIGNRYANHVSRIGITSFR